MQVFLGQGSGGVGCAGPLQPVHRATVRVECRAQVASSEVSSQHHTLQAVYS